MTREALRIWSDNCAPCRWVADRLTDACIWVIAHANPSRDNGLARRLRILANPYSTRPRPEGEE